MLFLKIIFSGIVSISTANVIQTPCPNKKILGTTLVHLKNNGKVKYVGVQEENIFAASCL